MKTIPLIIFFLLLLFNVYSLENCGGEVILNTDIPCYILLPSSKDCTNLGVSVYHDSSTLLFETTLCQYSPTQCNFTFNGTLDNENNIALGTYTWNYSTGDTGKINVEEDNMLNIFHLLVYGFLFVTGLILILFMHLFQEDYGTSLVYGSIASALYVIMLVMLASGFDFIRNVTFIVDINYYLMALFGVMSLYTGTVSYNFWKLEKKRNYGGLYD